MENRTTQLDMMLMEPHRDLNSFAIWFPTVLAIVAVITFFPFIGLMIYLKYKRQQQILQTNTANMAVIQASMTPQRPQGTIYEESIYQQPISYPGQPMMHHRGRVEVASNQYPTLVDGETGIRVPTQTPNSPIPFCKAKPDTKM